MNCWARIIFRAVVLALFFWALRQVSASPFTFVNGTDLQQTYNLYTNEGWNVTGNVAMKIPLAPGTSFTVDLKSDPAGNYQFYVPGQANYSLACWPDESSNSGHTFVGLEGTSGSYSLLVQKLPVANTSLSGAWNSGGGGGTGGGSIWEYNAEGIQAFSAGIAFAGIALVTRACLRWFKRAGQESHT